VSDLRVVEVAGGVRIEVRVTTRASRSEITGLHDGRLAVRLAAPPVDGEANEELVRLMASELGIPRASIRIVRGLRSRNKVLDILSGEMKIRGLVPGRSGK
jgi:uncharacterized protein (TIGR00251 family)